MRADAVGNGLGKDVPSGGDGRDSFWFDTRPVPANVDRITDFDTAFDTIGLSHAVYDQIHRGTLTRDAFYAGTAAHDATDRFLYDSATGKLFYDDDGTGAHAAVQFAQLLPSTSLSFADFLIT